MKRTKATGSKRGSRPRRNPTAMVSSRAKNSFSFDGTFLNGNLYADGSSTTSNIGSDFHQVGTDTNFGITRAFTNMVKQYREYRFTKLVIHWIPKVSPGVSDGGSQIHVAHTDNPEQMSFIMNGATTTAQRRNFTIGSKNNVAFNAWERFTWNVPITRRLPWFNVNTAATSITDINELSRAAQGLLVVGYASNSAAVTTLGTMKFDYHVELRGLDFDAGAVV